MVHHSHADGSHYPREECPIYQALRDGQVHHREDEVFWRKDGSSFPVSYTSTPILREGKPIGAVIIFSDITKRVRQREWEASRSALFTSILAQDPVEVTITALSKAFRSLHPTAWIAFQIKQGSSLTLLGGHSLPESLQTQLREVAIGMDSCACGRTAFWGREQVWSGECGYASHNVDYHQCLPILSSTGEVLGTASIFTDLCDAGVVEETRPAMLSAVDFARMTLEHAKLQQQLQHQAQHDLLTGLPNRMLLQDRLTQALAAAKRRDTKVGVCFIDLDRFKQVNDTLGHGMGDEYLTRITAVLRGSCREVDTLARQGGDEFILLLPDLNDIAEVEDIAACLLRNIRKPFYIGENEFNATASIGISVYPCHGETPSLLLQNADTALYVAKHDGRNRSTMYDPLMGSQVKEHAWVYAGLQQALAKNQLSLVYQPLYTLKEELTGFEALLRWNHPIDGLISPDRFIAIAEESGLIVPIGEWVLQEACIQAALWQGKTISPVSVAVNVSGVQLSQKDFVVTVCHALKESRLDPALLHLEITETWVVSDPQYAATQLEQLRALGVKISIDDFGAGQSSFGYLHNLPLDTLKIDQSFIARLDGSSRQISIVRALVHLAQQLGLRAVAEGVETEQQLEQLRSINCDLLQGFLLAKPLSPAKVEHLLDEQRPLWRQAEDTRAVASLSH